jgi:6-phosphogluconate dehydrogenase
MSNQEMSEVFSKWNEGELSSYLIEITSKILAKKDDVTSKGEVVDYVSARWNDKQYIFYVFDEY